MVSSSSTQKRTLENKPGSISTPPLMGRPLYLIMSISCPIKKASLGSPTIVSFKPSLRVRTDSRTTQEFCLTAPKHTPAIVRQLVLMAVFLHLQGQPVFSNQSRYKIVFLMSHRFLSQLEIRIWNISPHPGYNGTYIVFSIRSKTYS